MELTEVNIRKLNINIQSHSCTWHDDKWVSDATLETQSRLYFVKFGKLNYEIDGKKYTVTKGQMMLLPENRHVKVYMSKNEAVRLQCCNFNAIIENECIFDYMDGEWVATPENAKQIDDLFERFHRVNGDNLIIDGLEKKQVLLELLCIFIKSSGLSVTENREKKGRINFNGIADYIRREANSKDKMTVSHLAKMEHINYNYFIAEFSKHFGMSPMQYILEERIKSAKRQLEKTDLSIREIAENMHFENVKYFSNFFKKRTGMTPREYRNSKKV